MTKIGWIALLAAMAGDILVSWVLALFYKDYSNIKMSISALGNPQSPVRTPFNIWMLLEGVLFLVALPALYNHYHSVSRGLTYTLMVFVAVFAVGACIFTCFFSVNETKDVVTTASKIHGVGSVIGFMLFLFVPLLIAILSFKNNESMIGVISIICFVAALVFFALFVMSDKEEFAGSAIASEGLWQRLNLISMYLPLFIVAWGQTP
ncbi:MAG: DUF998 domain-containing protein [Lachnospiraceae bacterium]|nr:DUF998 domain-containing protein [Lachnospiraceae bacterium]